MLQQLKLPQGMGDQHPGQEQHACNADQRYEEIEDLFPKRELSGPDGAKIDQYAEAEAEEERTELYHMPHNILLPVLLSIEIPAVPLKPGQGISILRVKI